jgi:tetratricopeptide (TPR) repeat protein
MSLGSLHSRLREPEQAAARAAEALEVLLPVHGEAHESVAKCATLRGASLGELGRTAEAEEHLRLALRVNEGALPPGHPGIAASQIQLGILLTKAGRAGEGEAEPLLRAALETRRNALPAGHWTIASAESALGGCLTELGRLVEAEELLRRSVEALRGTLGDGDRSTQEAIARLARFLEKTGVDATELRALLPAAAASP